MNSVIASFAAQAISQRIGIPVEANLLSDGMACLDLNPSGSHPNDAFAIRFALGWRSAAAEFLPGKYAAPLMAQMGTASSDGKSALIAFASALNARKTQLLFRVNGVEISPFDSTHWPSDWKKVELQARSAFQVINSNDIGQMRRLIVELVVPVFGMVTALIGTEESDIVTVGELEGRQFQVIDNRYERKKINREACVQLKGCRCVACGFDFADFYGSLGYGYIEIHHTTPVSQIGPDYRINIITDMEPLCANCHAMVHREDPPVTITKLKSIIASKQSVSK